VIFKAAPLAGAFIVEMEKLEDERGFFARSWCRDEFRTHGLNPQLAQCSVSFNEKKGTLRGMHYQARPHEEAKLIRCTRGSIHDVIIDIRPASVTFRRHLAIVMNPSDGRMLYVPEGFAHGFLTLEDDTEIFYQMSVAYHPESSRGFRWNDPVFGIEWLADVLVISDRDRDCRDFDPSAI
jgi:dTDP-4-dehydrorhamnose 3,5-epimerase